MCRVGNRRSSQEPKRGALDKTITANMWGKEFQVQNGKCSGNKQGSFFGEVLAFSVTEIRAEVFAELA